MKQAKLNLFFIFLVVIAIAGMFLFFKSGTIQYPGHGVWAENWAETSTTTKSTIHIVGTSGTAKESVCFENLDGNLYNGAYLSGERFDNSGCPTYNPVVAKFYVQDNKPCIDIMDKHLFDAQCYYNPTDEQVSDGHPYDTNRVNCIGRSGAYACYISDVQTTLVLSKKVIIPQPPIQRIPIFSDLISQIIDWIKETFGALKRVFAFSIAGETKVLPGTLNSYIINLASPYVLQEDYSQGVYMQRWCSVALIDKTEKIINELPFEICKTDWQKTYNVVMPQGSFTDFAIISVMVETRQDFVNGAWVSTYQNKVINKESLSLSSKVIIPPTQATIPSGLKAIWDSISQFLANIWKGLFG